MGPQKRSSDQPKATPVVKAPAKSPFAAPNPLSPLVPKTDLAKAPAAPKPQRTQPAYGARGSAPHAAPVVPYNPATDPNAAHHTDLFHGGNTHLTAVEQAQTIKEKQGGKVTPQQLDHFHQSLRDGHIVPASIALAQLGQPIPAGFMKPLVTGLMGITDKAQRSTAIKALGLKNFAIYSNDADRKAIAKLLNLPENASEADILSHVNSPKHGHSLLDPHNWGETVAHPLFNDFVVGPAHLGLGALKLGGAALQEATMAGGLNPAHGVKEPDHPLLKAGKDLAEGEKQAGKGLLNIAEHPIAAWQADPIGLPIQVATAGEAGVAKLGSLAGAAGDAARLSRLGSTPEGALTTFGKAADKLSALRDKQNYTPRKVKLTQQRGADPEQMADPIRQQTEGAQERTGPPIPSGVQASLDNTRLRRRQEAIRVHNQNIKALREQRGKIDKSTAYLAENHDHAPLTQVPREGAPNTIAEGHAEAAAKIDAHIAHEDAAHAEKLRKIEVAHERGVRNAQAKVEGYVPPTPTIDLGFKSPKLITRTVQNIADRRVESGSSAIFRGRDAHKPFSVPPATRQDLLMQGAVKEGKSRIVAATKDKTDELLRKLTNTGKGLTTHDKIRLLETNAQGVTHEQMHAYRSGQHAKNAAKLKAADDPTMLKDIETTDREIRNLYRDPTPTPEVTAEIETLQTKLADLKTNALTRTERARLVQEQKNLQAHIDFHTDPATGKPIKTKPLSDKQQAFVNAAREIAAHGDRSLLDANRLDINSATHRNYEAVLHIRRAEGDPLAQRILDMRETLDKKDTQLRALKKERNGLFHERRTPRYQEIVDGIAKLEIERRNVNIAFGAALDTFREQHLATNAADPFRVPRQKPVPPKKFATPVQSGDLAGTPFSRSGRLKRTSSVQFTSGNYVPHLDPFVRDALRLQKDIGGQKFIDSITSVPKDKEFNHVGVTRAPRNARIGDIVHDPENWVLRSTRNVRRSQTPKGSDVAKNLDKVKQAEANKSLTELQAAWDGALEQETLHADTTVPAKGGPYVLVPKAVEEAMNADLQHRAAPAWVNQWFRSLALYTRPGYATRNIVQNVPLGMLEAPVGTLKNLAVPKIARSGKGFKISPPSAYDQSQPMVPGVEQSGLFGSHSAPTPYALSPTHIKQAITDLRTGTITKAQVADVLKNIHNVLFFDTVKAFSNWGENLTRRATGGAVMTKEAKILTKRMNDTFPDVQTALERIAAGDHPAAEAAANRVVNALAQTMGDYSKMAKAEKLSAVVPFWRWYSHIAKLMFALPFKYPLANQVIQGLGQYGVQGQKDLGQDFFSRSITDFPISGPLSNATTINTEAGNPFTSVLDVRNDIGSLAPLLGPIWDTARGVDQFNRPLTDRNDTPLDAIGKGKAMLAQILNLAAPVRLAEGLIHKGKRSPDSIPLLPVSTGLNSRQYETLTEFGAAIDPKTHKPNQSDMVAILNFLFGTGLNNKNLTGDEAANAIKAWGRVSGGKDPNILLDTHKAIVQAEAQARAQQGNP